MYVYTNKILFFFNFVIFRYFLKSKQSEEIVQKLPAIWRFVPQDRNNQEQRKRNISNQLPNKGPSGSHTVSNIQFFF